ncbi:MAG: SDR family NAD(P)-dependent oxidoreductase [Halobacteriales archaeon]
MRLEDRTAIVTGASTGIGRGIALAFAEDGANVVIADQQRESKFEDERPTVDVIDEAGGTAMFHRTDVTDEAAAESLIAATVERFGGLDILVNNAGVTGTGAVDDETAAEWRRIHAVNLDGVFHCSKHAIPELLESDHARIINISSQRGLRGGATNAKAAYVSSKGAVTNLTRQMAIDYAPEGIAVNAICPGPVESNMTRIESEAHRERLRAGVLTDFIGQPEDIAAAARFLASDGARFIHGHNLVVDGGYLVKPPGQ